MQFNSTTEQAPLCACGCGQPVLRSQVRDAWNRFLLGHNTWIQPHTNTLEKFWATVDKSAPDGCWPWMKPTKIGYGNFTYNGRDYLTHRLSWQLRNGPIPDGLDVLHSCDNRPCVNPSHLFLGTARENALDMVRKGRRTTPPLCGIANGSAKLTDELVRELRKEHRDQGTRVIDIARRLNMTFSPISAMLKNKTWRHII